MKIFIQAIGLAILLICLAACDQGATVEEHIARANQFITNAEYGSAAIELKNALQQDNQSGEARQLLGKVYLESGNAASAEKELRYARKLGWPNNDVIPALAKALWAQEKYTEVTALETTDLEPAAEATVLAMQAMATMSNGENPHARILADKALNLSPGHPEALLAKTQILSSQGELDDAMALLQTLIAADPGNASAWALVGDIHLAQQQPDEARSAYDKSIAIAPKSYQTVFKRALLNLQSGDPEGAQADADTLLRMSQQEPGANYLQGLIHYQAGEYEEAITSLSAAERAWEQFPLVLYYLGSAQLIQGHIDQATVLAQRFHALVPAHSGGRKLLATTQLQQGDYRKVQNMLGPVLEANPDDVDALNLMSNALLRDGKTDEGIALLQRVAELQPDSPVAQVKLGAGLLIDGQGEEAAQHMETALKLDPEFQQADILLVINHLQRQDYEAAIEAAEAFRRRNLSSTIPLNLQGKVYLAAGQQDKARASFEKALAIDADDPGANFSLAQMAIADGELTRARAYYNTVLKSHPDHLAALLQLALLDARENNSEALLAHMEQAIAAHPAALEPRLLLGRYHLSQGRPEKVAPLFDSLEEEQQRSPQVLQLLALSQLSAKEHGKAKYTLEQLIESTPDTADLHHMMARAAAGEGDYEQVEQELLRALEIDETHLPSRIALARLAMTQGEEDKFEQQLALLAVQAPDHPDALLLRAMQASRSNDSAAAVKLSERAFKVAPGSDTLLALGAYKEKAGDHEGTLELYREWMKTHPEDADVKMATAISLQGAQQEEESAKYFEQVIQLNPDNVVALNNLAWYMREQDPVTALGYVRRANKLAPNSADILDTLAVLEYINNDYKQAQSSIKQALVRSPNNPSILYHSAMIAAALGKKEAALETLRSLLAEGQDFPKKGEANALLKTLQQ